jgi:hypothetical protein
MANLIPPVQPSIPCGLSIPGGKWATFFSCSGSRRSQTSPDRHGYLQTANVFPLRALILKNLEVALSANFKHPDLAANAYD